MKSHFYFTGILGNTSRQMLADIEDYDNVCIQEEIVNGFKSKTEENLYNWWYSKVVPVREWSCGNIWNKRYPIYNLSFAEEGMHYIVFINSGLVKAYNKSFFKSLKKKNPNIRLILYVIDPKESWGFHRVERVRECFDLIVSHVESDCKEFGYANFPLMYSTVKNLQRQENKLSDMYFCGGNGSTVEIKNGVRIYGQGGRSEQIYNIYDAAVKKEIKTNIVINGVNPLDIRNREGDTIVFNNDVSNIDNIQNVINTNCILEPMHSGYQAITFRYLEAVCYNKKLLTSNKNVKYMKYYNPDYIKIFEKPEDIDFDWVKKSENVDYGYENDYSPIKFLEFIKKNVK